MVDTLLFAVAAFGNATTISLYVTQIVTFKRIIRKKCIEESSCIPYIIRLFNCLLFTWYGLPVVSYTWQNFPLVTVNGIGVLLHFSFLLIYFWFASPKAKMKVAMTAIPLLLLFCITVSVSAFALHDNGYRKLLVGSIGFGASAAMYGFPLLEIKKEIETKSEELMPLPISMCKFLANVLWITYGLLIRDIFVTGTNAIETPLSILQLILHQKNRKGSVVTKPNREDLENGNVETMDMEMRNAEEKANFYLQNRIFTNDEALKRFCKRYPR
ncbi:hypothetical protein VNO77_42211 [Canavalia gladiata]|uniref:Bidirectional sugar transporter SWEET n=1 Tax=Canavalia gladiata TaxID=3824 RepID=A0AAN9K0M2_CANGL